MPADDESVAAITTIGRRRRKRYAPRSYAPPRNAEHIQSVPSSASIQSVTETPPLAIFSDTVDNSADEDPKGNRLTLADKLLSTKKTPPQKKGTKKSVEEFYKRMEDTERAETAAFEIIGQRLQAIADKAKEARTTPRAVQTAVTEAF